MSKFKKSIMAFLILFTFVGTPIAATCYADDGTQIESKESGQKLDGNGATNQRRAKSGFLQVLWNPDDPDVLGLFLWLFIFADLGLVIYFIIDNLILISPEKLMPAFVVNSVQQAMAEGDVVKAMQVCEQNPSAMSSIVSAAFQHVEEGFEAIQEAVNAASDLEQEKIQQHLNWVSVCGNLGPSLGLLGTVEGMILTFNKLAETQPSASELAGSIGQALWTTAFGLIISIPAVAAFYALRNKANRIILRMTAVTMELLNGLRNVEVAPEDGAEGAEEMPA